MASSSMAAYLVVCRIQLDSGRRCIRYGSGRYRVVGRGTIGDSFDRARNALQRCPEIWKLDQNKHQADNPVQMLVREERYQSKHRHHFKLKLLRLVGHTFRQAM